MSIEAMKQVLVFLEHLTTHSWTLQDQNKAIELQRQAIEQAQKISKLEEKTEDHDVDCICKDCNELDDLEDIEQAQKQEPVACPYCHNSHTLGAVYFDQNCAGCVKRMTSPPQRQPLTEWQPIETAPDETEVFIGAFIDGVFKFGRSVRFYEQGNEFEGETWSGWVWSIDDCSDSVAEMPTHWMPLPSAPIEAAHGITGEQK